MQTQQVDDCDLTLRPYVCGTPTAHPRASVVRRITVISHSLTLALHSPNSPRVLGAGPSMEQIKP